MSEGLDAALVLSDLTEKPSAQYRTSPYTVRQYCALPYAQRRAVDIACDEQAGLSYTTHNDEASEKPYTVGRRVTTSIEAPSQPSSPQTTMLLTDALPASLFSNSTPDTAKASGSEMSHKATPATDETSPVLGYDLLAVVSRYLTLLPTIENAHWTHCGPSPFVRGDEHSLAVNGSTGYYHCYATEKGGRVLDFVMFMEECSQEEALDWLDANFPIEIGTAEVPQESTPLLADELEADGPSCDYSGFAPKVSTPDLTPVAEAPKDDFAALAEATAAVMIPAAEPTAPVALDGTIYSTTDYDQFHLLPENRVIDRKQVGKLVREISVKNMLHIKPIDVTADMGIIDGQHRREAARELGVPIFYRIGERLSGTDIMSLNVASKNWTGPDYLHYFTVLGRPQYVALTDYMKRHPILSFSNAVMLLQDTEETRAAEFRSGDWTASQSIETADETASFIQRIAVEVPSFKQSKSSRFIGAVLHCIKSVEGFSSERFLKKILLAPLKLVPCGNRKQYLTLFSEIYNFNSPKEQRINFL